MSEGICSRSEWLAALANPNWSLAMNTCRCDYLKNRWKISEKVMDEHLVFLVESGPMEATLDGEVILMESGTAAWVPPGCTRELGGDNRSTPLRYYKMRFNVIKELDATPFDRVEVRAVAWELLPVFRMLVAEYSNEDNWATRQLRSLLSIFSTQFFRLETPPLPGTVRTFTPAQRSAIDEFIATHLDCHLSSADLAREVQLSQDYFSRVFVRTYGEAPRTYVKRARVRHAANRLTESMVSVKELAAEMGYNNVNLFCRQFKEVEGMTPTHYRSNP